MLSHNNNNLFDLLKGEEEPTKIFGEVFIENKEIKLTFNKVEKEAKKRLYEMFSVKNKKININLLEEILNKMWKQDWHPDKGNINLFATDFGAILTLLILDKIKGKLIFRSKENLIDLSIWVEEKKIEVFPFHKIYKRLSTDDGESLIYFYNQLKQL